MRTITVVPYNPDWKNSFDKIKNELYPAVSDVILSIEHIGSTAVPGLCAKPIIDIDIVIEKDFFDGVKNQLAKIGYFHMGDLGIEGREAFKYENKTHLMEHHLYVCDKDADELKRHIALRDFLRVNKDYRLKYSATKITMANRYPHDIDNYILGKQPIIMEIYEQCGLNPNFSTVRLSNFLS